MDRTLTLTEEEQTLILAAIRGGSEWELSLADAHNLDSGKKIEPQYSDAMKTAKKFLQLRQKCWEQLEKQGRKSSP